MHKQKSGRDDQENDQQSQDHQDHQSMRIQLPFRFLFRNDRGRSGRRERSGMIFRTEFLHVARSGQVGGKEPLSAERNGDGSQNVPFRDRSGEGIAHVGNGDVRHNGTDDLQYDSIDHAADDAGNDSADNSRTHDG